MKLFDIVKLAMPPARWQLPLILALGVFAGLGFVVIYISRAHSYISEEPEVCMNCHIMAPQYATWQRGSHGRVTTCIDCHVPHNNIVRKYFFKGNDGMRHTFMFTFRMEPQVIRVKDAGMGAIQENCIRCHTSVVQEVSAIEVTLESHKMGEGKLCWECHRETPHGRVSSLASVPYARIPMLSPVTPEWLKNFLSDMEKKTQK